MFPGGGGIWSPGMDLWWNIWTAFPPREGGIWTKIFQKFKCSGIARGGCWSFDLTGTLVFNNAIHKLCKIQFWKKLFAIGFPNKHCNLTALPTREVGVESCDKAYSISHRELCGGDSIRPIYPVMGIGGNTIRPLRGNFYQVLAEMKLSLPD